MGWDIVAIGTNHNLPVEDPIKTAERLASLFVAPISVGYSQSWIFHSESNSIEWSEDYIWIEIARIGSPKLKSTISFSIKDYCARKLYSELADRIDSVSFANRHERDWFLSEAKDDPFELYQCECLTKPHYDLRIFKEMVEFGYNFPGRWFQLVRSFIAPSEAYIKENLIEFRKFIFSQLKACGCDKAYYFADQGPGEWLYDRINLPVQDWIDYLKKGDYIEDGVPEIIEVQKLLDNTLHLSENDWIDCFIDDFSDLG